MLSRNLEKEIEEKWVELLASIYMYVDWRKVARNHYAGDIFEHRVKMASSQSDIPSMVEHLCNLLGLQAPKLPLNAINFLRENEDEAMYMLRRWTRLLSIQAVNRAIEIRKERKKKGGKAESGEGDGNE